MGFSILVGSDWETTFAQLTLLLLVEVLLSCLAWGLCPDGDLDLDALRSAAVSLDFDRDGRWAAVVCLSA